MRIVSLFVGFVVALCGCSSVQDFCGTNGELCTSGNDAGSDVGNVNFPDGSVPPPTFSATCAQSTITVGLNQTTPTVSCTASKSVSWTIDRGEMGSVGPSSGSSTTFAPSGTTGGVVNVLASDGKSVVASPLFVKLTGQQSGGCPSGQIASSTSQLLAGGGVGGVGGEGCGGSVDTATATALASPSSNGSAQKLAFLYPYDATVWPRGMLAPLLQWSWTTADADAIQIQLATTSGSFSWTGTFSRPAILSQTSTAFIRHPIPQDIWAIATNTAGTKINGKRDDLTINLTIAKNGQGYGPIAETWIVAGGRMAGTINYNRYGGTSGNGATLAIKAGATAPTPVTNTSQCLACHTVAANGSDLVTDQAFTNVPFVYPLDGGSPVSTTPPPPYTFTFAGLTPDGTMLLTNSAPLPSGTSPNFIRGMSGSDPSPSQLFAVPSGTLLSATGLPTGLGAMMPAFSPDGKHVAFNDRIGGKNPDGMSLAMMDFNESTTSFSNLRTLDTPTVSSSCPNCADVWPSFLPTNDSIVFHRQVVADAIEIGGDCSDAHYNVNGATYITSLEGARGELWWVDVATSTAVRLDKADGKGYLPTGPNEHQDDTTLQYEPTVAPIASGGYAWIVFTSRRYYGNVATLNPWFSDAEVTGPWNQQPMTKKLWVAAIDLNAPPGTDPSHPAFYLPAQEIMNGNMRAYWVLDPCESDGSSCETGDQCCGGHCESSGGDGGLVCQATATCGGEGDVCTTSSQCCTGLQCVGGAGNGHCDVIPVN